MSHGQLIPENEYITLDHNTSRCGEQAVTVESVEKHHGADSPEAFEAWRSGKGIVCAFLPSGIAGIFVTDYLEWQGVSGDWEAKVRTKRDEGLASVFT